MTRAPMWKLMANTAITKRGIPGVSQTDGMVKKGT